MVRLLQSPQRQQRRRSGFPTATLRYFYLVKTAEKKDSHPLTETLGVYQVPVGISLGVIAALLAGSMNVSLLRPPADPPLPQQAADANPVPRSTEADL